MTDRRKWIFAALGLLLPISVWGWGQDGHSIVAEIAQRRLDAHAVAMVDRLLGRGNSLASIASWADDVRSSRTDTYNWHFVDIPVNATKYEPSKHCSPTPKGDCVVAELNRLRRELRCAADDDLKRDALRYAVHFVGDIHQPLHTVGDARGGNDISVDVEIMELKCTRNCQPRKFQTNFHAFWDESVITSTVWDWGAYVTRLEDGWLKTQEAKGATVGKPVDWALETHALARIAWNALPADRRILDAYYKNQIPVVDGQLGRAGLRLARLLNEAYASDQCN